MAARVRWWGVRFDGDIRVPGDDHGDWGTLVRPGGTIVWDSIDGTNEEPWHPHDRFSDGQVIVGCLTPEAWAALEHDRLCALANDIAAALGLVGAT